MYNGMYVGIGRRACTGEMMTQPNHEAQFDQTVLLQDTLRLLAQHHTFVEVMPQVLRTAKQLTAAHAAFFVMFDTPYAQYVQGIEADQLPDGETLASYALELAQAQNDIYIGADVPPMLANAYKGWLAAPIRLKGQAVGLLALLYSEAAEISEETVSVLSSLVDAVTIVCISERTIARHQLLARNQNEFVRITTHDLRSPLTALRGFASMLESMVDDREAGNGGGGLDERHARFIEKILSGVDQMASLVDNIQDAGRFDPETGFYEMERSPVDLIALVRDIVDGHLLPAEKQDLTLTVSATDDVPIVNVDEMMIQRAVTNLVDNAIKYTPNGGQIEVGVGREGADVVISVSDTGLGISKENLKQIFHRHFRIHRQEHMRVKGSGLGLFIVRAVALRHGGDAKVESVEGEGSTFSFRIPLSGDNLLIPRMPDDSH